ncbi:MAG: hypothetical protein P8172_10505 [Gammaproteobacteria bacterium]
MFRCRDLSDGALGALFDPYALECRIVRAGAPIPGSYWGAPEAGLVGAVLHYRGDTPLHSALHEGAHYICATPQRRARLHTDAGGDDLEECAVCYLQVLLADRLPGVERARLFADMDDWGYSFRLGSTAAWFEADAEDAIAWLVREGLVDREGRPRGTLRGSGAAADVSVESGSTRVSLL